MLVFKECAKVKNGIIYKAGMVQVSIFQQIVLGFVFALCLVSAEHVYAQGSPADVPASCDAEFLDVIRSRSWMEAKREVEMAQLLIRKPDSVLEYSCFNTRITEMGNAATALFSDNITAGVMFHNESFSAQDLYQPNFNSPAGPVGMGSEPAVEGADNIGFSTTTSLQAVVRDAMTSYLQANFGHSALGGAMSSSGGAGCDFMYQVWDFAKCNDFEKDYFVTFEELAGINTPAPLEPDPRALPSPCNEAVRMQRWQAALNVVNPPPPSPPAVPKTIETYLDRLSGSCTPPMPTGLLTYDVDGRSTIDVVCPTPGCWYNANTRTCRR